MLVMQEAANVARVTEMANTVRTNSTIDDDRTAEIPLNGTEIMCVVISEQTILSLLRH